MLNISSVYTSAPNTINIKNVAFEKAKNVIFNTKP